ncbi:hypothetical protein [Haloferula sargassicola]
MDSPLGFKSDEQMAAMEEAREIVDDLSVNELKALIRFYRRPDSWKLPLMGFDLVGSLIYERWGKLDGQDAVDAITRRVEDQIEKNGGAFDANDPFRDPDLHEMAVVFWGWSSSDPMASGEGLRQMLDELGRRGIEVSELEEGIRSKLRQFAQPPAVVEEGEDPFVE